MKWTGHFHRGNIRGDIYGGVTAAIVALPLALAFGVASGVGPVSGLYGAICIGFFAAVFGGTPAQISGPTGPMTVVMAAIFVDLSGRDPAQGPALAFTVVMLGGVFQILFGMFKIGRYISLIPFSVISGFMSGIGAIIILLQLAPLLGHPAPEGGTLGTLLQLPELIRQPVPTALGLGLFTLAIVFLLPVRIGRLVPPSLLALVAGTFVLWWGFPAGSASTLGQIPAALPALQWPVFTPELLGVMLKAGFSLGLLGAIDSLLTSLVADNITRTYHDSNRELIGQGIGNIIAGVCGGLPGAGATMRTVVNVRAGGQTPLSGMLHAAILLAVVLGTGGLAEHIPHAVLAGILIKVGIDIVDWDFFRRLRRAPRPAVVLMFTVLLVTVFVDLIAAVGIGVIGASLLLVCRMADLQLGQMKILTHPGEEVSFSAAEADLFRRAEGRILLCQFTGPLSFGAAKDMSRNLTSAGIYQVLILDMANVPSIDFTSSKAIEDIIRDATDNGHRVYLACLGEKAVEALQRLDITGGGPLTYMATTRLEALEAAVASL
ncbi:MAG: STAS domain-containing protein [Candidatus Latescibacteria bacterium]|nr:STAS domain-containing protein [Candidatus Latescibacterota bacterium]